MELIKAIALLCSVNYGNVENNNDTIKVFSAHQTCIEYYTKCTWAKLDGKLNGTLHYQQRRLMECVINKKGYKK